MQFPAVIELSSLGDDDGFVVIGASAEESSGVAVGAAGDVNGDGVGDLIIGAYRADSNAFDSGATYVVFGRSDGFASPLHLSSLSPDEGFVINGISELDLSGASARGAGDVNGDGIDDVIVGSDRADPNGLYAAGAGYVVFGRTAGFAAPVELSSLDADVGVALNGGAEGDYAGRSVSAAGDVNGDGIDDVIVGAYGVGPDAPPGAGAAYVVFGRSDGFGAPVELSSLDGGAGFALTAVAPGDRTGSSVSDAGDVNGDGIDDLIVGAPEADPNGSNSGAAYVVFGRTTGFAGGIYLTSLNGSTGFALHGVAADDRSGLSVGKAGDVNGDGIDDVIVGAPDAAANGPGAGAAYVVFGRTTGFAAEIDLSSLDGGAGFVIGASAGEQAGLSVAGAGDLNGDGIDDVIVGAFAAQPHGPFSGAAYVVFGRTAFGASVDLSSLDGTGGFVLNGASVFDFAGWSVNAAGDVNADGVDDLIVGARGADANGDDAGASYVIFGRRQAADVTAIADDTGTVGDGVTTDRTLTVSGTATVGTTVHVFRGAVEIGTTTVAADGTWSLADPSPMLPLGPHVYRAQAEGAGGTLSPKSDGFEAFIVDPTKTPSAGSDAVLGTAAANQIQGGEGNDTLFGEAGNDTLKGNNGNDWLFGGEGSDRLEGENGSDVANGGNGNDTVYGQNGNDTLRGENGADRLEGGSGLDSLDGGAGNDTLYGGIDRDTLFGGAGGDQLYGDADGDWLMLGSDAARDTVFGTIAHLGGDTIDGFVDGMPTVPGADLVFVTAMTNAQRKEIDGDILDAQGRLFLPGGGTITFLGHAGAEVDAVNAAGGVQIWLV